mmetsp:Transcript_32286/g.52435  ORF Transcript_32286/g.52435 Transcript_32286/m.52435 type:complete len:139 (-) Transcript_32286:288-704(-)|eukprot:CAMPEP_0174333422 /NCGR_PEP_ID=MMETSP0810-20121108/19143_1 /TAXON_ID=73025 ORGANISM="Eutreptiella gymnastica-like, Strain CCMP1594" /NCGR_SAMPLE_ID=MMETSP0810 /ASSEMBLY_ACC=CAM_ASM_000659 /LENGTH=138 /DNA_ID=CAMNT_0015450537 /DNA_START=659 /DNA_END=1075 /DNA_ORIENTATION=-
MLWLSTPNPPRPSSGTGAGTLSWGDVSSSTLTILKPRSCRGFADQCAAVAQLCTPPLPLRVAALLSGHTSGSVHHQKKEKLWVQSLRALRHQSMQAITKFAAQLLQEKWSIMEDIFRSNAATCALPPETPPTLSLPRL